ncbi:MAG: Holliday junction branch migration protein RuvA [Actinobacteria bacterium]|nr:Holliday junction branch migration protein RuvA [Actinomycetota bacterium]
MSGLIGSLRGTLVARSVSGEVLVEVGGVGYRVVAGPVTVARLGDAGTEVFVWIHHHVREDAETLYGFVARDDRDCFEALLGAHGVGPALALAILSVHGPDALRRVLADDDVASLCLVPGVGKKTAARLLVELKSRLDLPDADLAAVAAGAGAGGPVEPSAAARADVRDALAGLGYAPEEIADALRHLADADSAADSDADPAAEGPAAADVPALLKRALRHLAGAR